MPHNHQCYTLGNHCAEFHLIPRVGRNQCKFPIPCKSPFAHTMFHVMTYEQRRARLVFAFFHMMQNARKGPLCNLQTMQAQISLHKCAG